MSEILRFEHQPKWGVLVLVVGIQCVLVLLLALDWRLPFALVLGGGALLAGIRWPLFAVGLVVGSRILSTGSMSWLRVGGLNIGLFEPMLFLGLTVLVVHAVLQRRPVFSSFPWRAPLLAFLGWQVLSLCWAHRLGAGIQDLVAVGVILVTSTMLLAFVRTWDDFRYTALAWVAASLVLALLSVTTDFNQVADTGKVWEIAAKGGRETGLGQQPNWFAMNLMFSILLAFGLALTERKWIWRFGLVIAGVLIFLAQLRSGSRGGAYSIVIGALLVGCARPLFRKWVLRIGLVGVALFAAGILFGEESTRKGFMRIWLNLGNLWRSDVRARSWWVCIQMLQDTWGLGIGPGSFAALLEEYDWKLYSSVHRYPHGIFWGVLAHYGLIGLGLAGWGLVAVWGMARDFLERVRGTPAEVFAWVMPATLVGYVAWSFVEFNFDDKPFWEYLALFTALCLADHPGKAEPGSELEAEH